MTFQKNDTVYLIRLWSDGVREVRDNDSIVFSVRKCTVVSCGKQRMHLRDAETGETVGTQYKPTHEQYSNEWVTDLDQNAAMGIAARMGSEYRTARLTRTTRLSQGEAGSDRYRAMMAAEAEGYANTVVSTQLHSTLTR